MHGESLALSSATRNNSSGVSPGSMLIFACLQSAGLAHQARSDRPKPAVDRANHVDEARERLRAALPHEEPRKTTGWRIAARSERSQSIAPPDPTGGDKHADYGTARRRRAGPYASASIALASSARNRIARPGPLTSSASNRANATHCIRDEYFACAFRDLPATAALHERQFQVQLPARSTASRMTPRTPQ